MALRAWLAAYAAATSTATSYDAISRAAMPGEVNQPAKTTTITWREALARIWMLDSIDAWLPGGNQFKQLGSAPKHHLADPALAARLLGATEATLLAGMPTGPRIPRDGTLLGALFESLVAISVQTYAAAAEAKVSHLRTRDGGRHEIDLIVERADQQVVAFEVKLAPDVDDYDAVRHLAWLRFRLGDRLADAAIITAGTHAFGREDGITVIPAALLGP